MTIYRWPTVGGGRRKFHSKANAMKEKVSEHDRGARYAGVEGGVHRSPSNKHT